MKSRRSFSRRRRPDDADAFFPDPSLAGSSRDPWLARSSRDPSRATDVLARTLAEEFLAAATSAEEAAEAVRDAVLPEEVGGPFIEVRAATEFDRAPDQSNPADGAKEPFPRAMRAPYR